ncbi:NAD(P)-dependent oxidoreductase [Massilia sp.]|uniref:NAD(P)-dependent oxidoreductase n=1 Tax=Massilia sp. TaxID=1882437 RepID=UPI00352F95EA
MRHHIVFLDQEGIGPSVKMTELPFPHTWESHAYTNPDQVVERLKHATVAMTCSVPLRAEHLRQLPRLEMISLALTGTDIVDLDYCHDNGITVTNVPAYAANTVAEHALAMIFELSRKVGSYHRLLREVHLGNAPVKNIYFDFPIRDVGGRTLGIVGNGPIAHRLAALAQGVGLRVQFSDRNGEFRGDGYVPLQRLLADSDIISINCPLTEETRDMIGAAELARMKPGVLLVNTARGGIINEAALIEALQAGRIGGAALDVVEHEPLRRDDPLFALIDRHDFILNPHVAWSSEDAMQGLIDQALGNITAHVRGEAPANAILKVQP